MGSFRPVRPPFAQVSGQPSLNRRHPLARGMTDCLLWNILAPPNLAAPTGQVTLTSSPTLVPTKFGNAGYATAGSSFGIPDHGNTAAGDLAVRVLARIISWPGTFTALFDKGAAAGAQRELSLFFGTSGDISFVAIGLDASASVISTGMTAGETWDLVLTRSGSTVSAYVNGVFKGTSTVAGTSAVAVPMNFGVNPSGGNAPADAQYITAQVWNRALSADEIFQLYRDPYCFLTYPQDAMRVGVIAAGGFIPAWAMNSNLPVIGTGTY